MRDFLKLKMRDKKDTRKEFFKLKERMKDLSKRVFGEALKSGDEVETPAGGGTVQKVTGNKVLVKLNKGDDMPESVHEYSMNQVRKVESVHAESSPSSEEVESKYGKNAGELYAILSLSLGLSEGQRNKLAGLMSSLKRLIR